MVSKRKRTTTMLALVNSDNPEPINQHALSIAACVLVEWGDPYMVFFNHERCVHSDPRLDPLIGTPSQLLAGVWMRAEDAALESLPVVNDDTYLVWMGDN
jgi:hypothetical protein